MIAYIVSFILGFLVFPVIFSYISSSFIISKTKKFPESTSNFVQSISKNMEKEMLIASFKNVNLSWANVIIQRIFLQISQNYFFENKLKNIIIKNFINCMGKKFGRRIRIRKIEFGSEAPYIKSMQLITIADLEKLKGGKSKDLKEFVNHIYGEKTNLKRRNNSNSTIYSCKTIHFESIVDLSSQPYANTNEDPSINSIKDMSFDFNGNIQPFKNKMDKNVLNINQPDCLAPTDKYNLNEPECSNTDEENIDISSIYNMPVFCGELAYSGSCELIFDVEISKEVVLNCSIALESLITDFALKIPDNDYNLEFCISFIKNPSIDLKVVSRLETNKYRPLFRHLLTKFTSTAAKKAIKNAVYYPNWYQFAWPFFGSEKNFTFKPLKIENLDNKIIYQTRDEIINFICANYETIKIKNNITRMKSGFTLNNRFNVLMWKIELMTYNNLTDTQIAQDEGSSVCDQLRSLKILKNIIPGVQNAVMKNNSNDIDIVILTVNEIDIEYIRFIYKSLIIFYRNSSEEIEFFGFKLDNSRVIVYSYSEIFKIYFTNKKISNFYKILLRYFDTKKDRTVDTDTVVSPRVIENKNMSKQLYIENLFKEALQLDEKTFQSYCVSTNIAYERLKAFIRNREQRKLLMLYDEAPLSRMQIGQNIEAQIFLSDCGKKKSIFSLFEKNMVVDICDKLKSVVIFKINKKDDSDKITNELQLFYKTEKKLSFPNYFIESFKIQESFECFFINGDKIEYITSENIIYHELKINFGTLYFEFTADNEGTFELLIFSCKLQKKIIKINNIYSSDIFRIIVPVQNDFIKITVKSQNKKQYQLKYKIVNLPKTKSMLLCGKIKMKCRNNFKIKFLGSPTHFIFWQKDSSSAIKSFLKEHDSKHKITIDNFGLFRSEEKEYALIHKNLESQTQIFDIQCGITDFN